MKKTLEALGLTWVFSENSELADMERSEMREKGTAFALAGGKPSEKSFIFSIMEGNYPDICSSLESLTGPELDPIYQLQLVDVPAVFFELVKKAYKEGKYGEIRQLRAAAIECNPQWYPVEPLAEAPEEVKEAAQAVAEAQDQIDPEGDSDEPLDEEAVMEAAETLVDYGEEKAKEAGKVGPATFPLKTAGRKRK